METKGINILKEALKTNQGRDAIISTSHKLYGSQKLKCKLNPLVDECRIGFYINQQEIYIDIDGLVDYGIKDGIHFANNLMEINIKL